MKMVPGALEYFGPPTPALHCVADLCIAASSMEVRYWHWLRLDAKRFQIIEGRVSATCIPGLEVIAPSATEA